MVRMSDVWDRASQVIAGRLGILASIAFLFLWLPGVVRTAAQLAVGSAGTVATAGIGGVAVALLGLVLAAVGAIGHLALVAVASDPAVTRGDALRIALARFWPYVGVMLIVVIVAALLVAPVFGVLAAAYPGVAAMRAGTPPPLSSGTGLFVALYSLAAVAVLIWAEARVLSALVPVVVNERLGVGSFARAFALTRGLGWRIVGVMLLFAVVTIVGLLALRSVVGVVIGLSIGTDHAGLATLVGAAVLAVVGCVISVVVSAFTAQLYLAARAQRPIG